MKKGGELYFDGDMNIRIGDIQIGSMVKEWSVDGVKKNGECLVDVCGKRSLLGNIFQHKIIHRYIWRRKVGREIRKKEPVLSLLNKDME